MYRLIACVLSGMLLALAAPVLAGTSTWQGASLPNLPVGGTRSWIDVNNWVGGVVPPAGDTDDFGLTGDGDVTLDGNQSVGGITLQPWVGYNFSPGSVNPSSSLQGPPSPATLTVGDNIRSTSTTDYFIGPSPTAPAPWAVQVGCAADHGRSGCAQRTKHRVPEFKPQRFLVDVIRPRRRSYHDQQGRQSAKRLALGYERQ